MLPYLAGASCVFVGVLLGAWLAFRLGNRQSPLPSLFSPKVTVTGGETETKAPKRKL